MTGSTPAKSCAQDGRASSRAHGSRSPLPAMPEYMTTASRRVLLGMVPVSMHTPPTQRRFSTTAARLPGRRLHGRPLAGRPGADADEIEVMLRGEAHPVGGYARDIAPASPERNGCATISSARSPVEGVGSRSTTEKRNNLRRDLRVEFGYKFTGVAITFSSPVEENVDGKAQISPLRQADCQ